MAIGYLPNDQRAIVPDLDRQPIDRLTRSLGDRIDAVPGNDIDRHVALNFDAFETDETKALGVGSRRSRRQTQRQSGKPKR